MNWLQQVITITLYEKHVAICLNKIFFTKEIRLMTSGSINLHWYQI